jgi:hypothetical protein
LLSDTCLEQATLATTTLALAVLPRFVRPFSTEIHFMFTALTAILATNLPSVPDSGSTGLLLGLGILATGIVARVIKNRK